MNQNMKPIAPDCKVSCPQIRETRMGTEYSYCNDCNDYLNQSVTAKNAERILRNQDAPPTTRAAVIARAEAAHVQHAQYADHWSGPEWNLARIKTRQDKGKMGLSFEAGDITIAREQFGGDCDGLFFAYSWRNEIDTAVRPRDIEILKG